MAIEIFQEESAVEKPLLWQRKLLWPQDFAPVSARGAMTQRRRHSIYLTSRAAISEARLGTVRLTRRQGIHKGGHHGNIKRDALCLPKSSRDQTCQGVGIAHSC